ncbi:LysR family transcriptional regulator [Pararhizobium sp. IMCC21322]|uniref:LysR family transcriptional regulator n=1 Tax=Pararhizobium sp. IMCC21322 TaxID=3067903 RepID=UPI0027409B13|nr:LysR family transcriptional regulator [Pararhizobium sp. IMCC21322]
MRISWDLIRTFQSVAQTGSLSAAARALQLTQPTIGRHIDLLEDALNVSLFIRGREGMQLTPKGADLIESAKQMGSAATGFARHASGLDEDISGVVRISANEVFGVLILPRMLPEFLDNNPGIEIELVVDNSATNLTQRDADVAIRMFRPKQNDLVARKIAELPLGLYAHHNYLSKYGVPKTLSELHAHRLIGFDRETSLIDASRTVGAVFTPEDFALRCDNILTHIEAIRSGVGIGVTHQGLADQWKDVDQVLPDIALPNLELWIACHSEVRHNKRLRKVMDFLGSKLKNPYESVYIAP